MQNSPFASANNQDCPISSAANIQDPQVRRCRALIEEARGPIREQVANANQRLSQIAGIRTSDVRAGAESNCQEVARIAGQSNSEGVRTLDEALNLMQRLHRILSERRAHFELQASIMTSTPSRRSLQTNYREKLDWYFGHCGAPQAQANCANNAHTFTLTRLLGPMPAGGAMDWAQRQQQFIRQLDAIKREHEGGASIYANYVSQVERSISAAQASKQSLAEINSQITNLGVASDCQSVNDLLARQDETIRGARSIGAEANASPVSLPERVGSDIPAPPASARPAEPGVPNPVAGQQISLEGDPVSRLAPSTRVVNAESGGRQMFLSQRTLEDGRTVYWAVMQDPGENGRQSVMALDQSEYARLSAENSQQEWRRYENNFDLQVQPDFVEGRRLAPGALDFQPDIREQNYGAEGGRVPFAGQTAAGVVTRTGVAPGPGDRNAIVAENGQRLTAEQVAQVIEQRSRGQGLTAAQRQGVAETLIEQANLHGGQTFEERREFVARYIARMQQESNFNATIVSSANAIGLTQILPTTAEGVLRSPEGAAVQRYMAENNLNTTQCLNDPFCNLRLSVATEANMSRTAGFHGANPYVTGIAYYSGPGSAWSRGPAALASRMDPSDPRWLETISSGVRGGTWGDRVAGYTFLQYARSSDINQELGGTQLPLRTYLVDRGGPSQDLRFVYRAPASVGAGLTQVASAR